MRLAFLTSLLLTACTIGDAGTTNSMTPDAGSNAGSNTDPNSLGPCVDRATEAQVIPAHTHTAGGGTNAGTNCIVSGCHANNAKGVDAPGYQFAGTVYLSGTTNPAAGVIVRIKSTTKTLDPVVTDSAGNFTFLAGQLQGTYSAVTDVTGCPTIKPMVTVLASGGGPGAGSCNSCHVTGGAATPIYF